MHDPIETGKTIERLRKQAGYTQKSLADALNVTDKAVSKWERGISSPNISLLPKLSALLDADMGAILSGIKTAYTFNWKGILFLGNTKISPSTLVYDKPMVYYLLSIYLLVGIREVLIVCSETNYSDIYSKIKNGKELGIKLEYFVTEETIPIYSKLASGYLKENNVFVCYDNLFYFGASLSRQLQGFMSSTEKITSISSNSGHNLPMILIPEKFSNVISEKLKKKQDIMSYIEKNMVVKKLSRGIITVPFNSYENISEISTFVNFFQKYNNQNVCDIYEIAKNRGFF